MPTKFFLGVVKTDVCEGRIGEGEGAETRSQIWARYRQSQCGHTGCVGRARPDRAKLCTALFTQTSQGARLRGLRRDRPEERSCNIKTFLIITLAQQ